MRKIAIVLILILSALIASADKIVWQNPSGHEYPKSLAIGDLPVGVSAGIVTGSAAGGIGAGLTRYMPAPGGSVLTTEMGLLTSPVAGQIIKMTCTAETPPTTNGATMTMRKRTVAGSWASTTITCSMSGLTNTCSYTPSAYEVPLAQGDKAGIQIVTGLLSIIADVTCTLQWSL